MIKIAVCDDEKYYLDKIQNHIANYAVSYNFKFEIDKFEKSLELADAIKKNKYDIAFLDVEMDFMDGIDLGCAIKKASPQTLLVYISGYIDYSLQGYKVKAFSYILKPDLDQIFAKEMDSVIAEITNSKVSFPVMYNSDIVHVLFSDIMYIMSEQRKIVMVLKDNQRYEFYSTMDEQESLFSWKNFLRVQQGYMINLKYAVNIKDYEIHLFTGETIRTSRNNFKLLKEKYAEIKGNM